MLLAVTEKYAILSPAQTDVLNHSCGTIFTQYNIYAKENQLRGVDGGACGNLQVVFFSTSPLRLSQYSIFQMV